MFKTVQNKILALNGIHIKPLVIPEKYKDIEDEKKLITKWLSESKPKFTCYQQPLHPNVIRYFKKLDIIFGFKKNGQKISILLKNNVEIQIMKQYHFTYLFYIKIIKLFKKNKIKNYIDDEGYIKNQYFMIEKKCITDTNTRRSIDICFVIDDENKYSIGIEYLEDYHLDERKYECTKQQQRLVDIMFNYSLVHWIFVWDYKFKKNKREYLDEIARHFLSKVKDYQDINNEKKYVVSKLNEIINNKKFCESLYNAYSNENEYVIKLSELTESLRIKDIDKIVKKFKEEVDFIIKLDELKLDSDDDLSGLESNDDDSSSSDDDSCNSDGGEEAIVETVVSSSLNEKKYYEEKNDDIFLTNYGLTCFLGQINKDNVQHSNDLFGIRMLQNNVAKAAYLSVCEMRKKELELKESIIWGWKD